MMNEIWKTITGYEGKYEISNLGRVKSLKRKHYPERILKPRVKKKGYLHVHFKNEGEDKNYTIHRLVATAFIPNPHNHPQVNHKNGNKSDNNSANLEWCNNKQNCVHAMETKLWNPYLNRAKAVTMYSSDWEPIMEFVSMQAAARHVGGFSQNIWAATKRNIKVKGFYWRLSESKTA